MTWAKLDDHADEELAHLSANAFRLYVSAIPYSRRRQLGGMLTAREFDHLARSQRLTPREAGRAVGELLDSTEGSPLWLPESGGYVIRSYEKYNPPTSAERVRRHRSRNAGVTLQSNEASVTETPEKRSLAYAPARRGPEPDPVPVVLSVSNETLRTPEPVASAEHPFGRGEDDPLALAEFVAAYEAVKREAGVDVGLIAYSVWGEVDGACRDLLGKGADPQQLLAAVRLNAANPKASPRRIDIELTKLQQRPAQPEPKNDYELARQQISERAIAARRERGELPPAGLTIVDAS